MVAPWKLILATALIFCAGVVTGAFVVQRVMRLSTTPTTQVSSSEFGPNPWFVRREFLDFMDHRLDLTPQQREQIGKILEDSQERTKVLMSLIWPEIGEELGEVTDKIRQELTPTQLPKFEEMLRSRPVRAPDTPLPATNAPSATSNQAEPEQAPAN